jgi:hypothetical protein
MQAGANVLVGIGGLVAMVAAVFCVLFGIYKLLHHDLIGIIPIIVAVGISAWAVPIVNTAFHGMGSSAVVLESTTPD